MKELELTVVQLPCGPIETNAFLVIDDASREALIIDAPPESLERLKSEVDRRGAKPVALVLTHTHWDHIGDVAAIVRSFNIPALVHELDAPRLTEPGYSPVEIEPHTPERLIADGDSVSVGDREFLVMHTPGHSHGQISLYSERDGLLIGGDTLFPNGYGRVDIPGASREETVATIRRLLELPDDVTVLTGHGASTTIGRERRWMQRVAETGELFE